MILGKADARHLIQRIREVKRRYKSLAGEELCDRGKCLLGSLDLAELLTGDEVTPPYQEPGEMVILRKVVQALELVKQQLVERLTRRPETNGLFDP